MSTSSNPDYGIQPASATGGVSLLDKTIFHEGSASMRTAGLVIQDTGIVNWRRTFTFVQLNPLTDWIIPNSDASSSYEVRITNLNWIIKDEGFGISPSGGVWIDSVTTPTGGDSDGDEDSWFDLGTAREWTFVDNDNDISTGIQHAQFDMQIRRGVTVLATAAMDWYVNSSSGGGGGGGGGCFVYGTEMIMADNSLKEIQDITLDDVMKEGGRVKATQIGDGRPEDWFDVDGAVVTGTHGIRKDGVWMRVEDAGYPKVPGADRYYVVSNVNHKMVTSNGQVFTDYQEVDYMSSGWDDWVMDYLNGNSSVDVLRNAIISTGLESKRARAYIEKEGIYKEDYDEQKNRLLRELYELEESKRESVLARIKK